jgi:hypothetical protein
METVGVTASGGGCRGEVSFADLTAGWDSLFQSYLTRLCKGSATGKKSKL